MWGAFDTLFWVCLVMAGFFSLGAIAYLIETRTSADQWVDFALGAETIEDDE